MSRQKTDKQFKKEVYDLVGDEYIFLDTYVKAKTKLKVKHTECGHIYEVSPNNFLRGKRCPYCSSSAKKTDAQFKQEVYNLVGNEYMFVDSYQGALTRIRVKHNKCGRIYEGTPANFLWGSRCHYCDVESKKKTDTQFKREVLNLVGTDYTFLDSYVNAKTKLRVKHNICGHIYEVRPDDFLQGTRCPYCFGCVKKTNEQFKNEVFDLVGSEYIFLDNYIDAKTKLKVKHTKCDSIYEVTPNAFINGSRCPYCNSPKGELIISNILDTLNINYETQKTFDDLRDIQLLSYDFYIPDQNILIEYQGIQHYQPVDYFGGIDAFKLQQKHDKMKADYAKSHNYNLITIPYTEDTLSKIEKYLINHRLFK